MNKNVRNDRNEQTFTPELENFLNWTCGTSNIIFLIAGISSKQVPIAELFM